MQARRYVEAPAAKPLPYGLLSAALVINDTDEHLGLGVQYETLMCGGTHSTQDACISDTTQDSPWLTGDDGKDVVVADAFHIYAMHTCRSVGNFTTAEADARTRLENGGSRGIEEGFEAGLLTADDITPAAGAVHPMAGLALLEQYAAANYGGVPVVHVPRGVGTLLGQMGGMTRQGNRLETVQGAVIASGGGYSGTGTIDGTPADGDTTAWMRVTGAVVIRRGPVQTYPATLRRATTSGTGRVVGAFENDFSAFAQQPVTASYECINAAVLVQAPAGFYSSDGGAP